MIRQWDEYTAGPTKPRDERLHVTLNQKGVIFLNRKMHEVLGRPAAAILLFDRRNGLIGIRPANSKHAFPLKKKSVGTGRIIHASPFCRHHGMQIDRAIVFHNPDLDDDGTLMLNLETATHIGRKRANRAAARGK